MNKSLLSMLGLTCILYTFCIITGSVGAESVKYKVRILPKDCIFEVIDIGTQELRFLTPETCPKDPIETIIEPPYDSPDNPIVLKPKYTDYYWFNTEQQQLSKNTTEPSVASSEESSLMVDLIKPNKDNYVVAISTAMLILLLLKIGLNLKNRSR